MADFIAAQRVEHEIRHAAACRAFGVSPARFYKWRHGDASPRRARRAQLALAIGPGWAAVSGSLLATLMRSIVVVVRLQVGQNAA